MQTHFEHELDKLQKRILTMSNLAIGQVSASVRILFSGETDEIETLVQNENIIDELDIKVDKLCQQIFVLNQPVATDLRFIMSSLRIGNELERIGDIAFSIVNKSETLREEPGILQEFEIEPLFNEILDILKRVIRCYEEKDISETREIIFRCKIVNEKCQRILDKVIFQMINKSEIIIFATYLILILRQIERLADHSSNISESVYFMIEGEIIKHAKNDIPDNVNDRDENDFLNQKNT